MKDDCLYDRVFWFSLVIEDVSDCLAGGDKVRDVHAKVEDRGLEARVPPTVAFGAAV